MLRERLEQLTTGQGRYGSAYGYGLRRSRDRSVNKFEDDYRYEDKPLVPPRRRTCRGRYDGPWDRWAYETRNRRQVVGY